MEPLRANVPKGGLGLFSPGLKKFGQGVGRAIGAYVGRLANVARMPGDAYRGRQFTPEETLDFTLTTLGAGMPGGAAGRSALGTIAKPAFKSKFKPWSELKPARDAIDFRNLGKQMDVIRKTMVKHAEKVKDPMTNRLYQEYAKQLSDLTQQKYAILKRFL